MAYEEIRVNEPIPCPEAFGYEDEYARLSQAALLLSLSYLLHPREGRWLEETTRFPLPDLPPVEGRLSTAEIDASMRDLFGRALSDAAFGYEAAAEHLLPAAMQLYAEPSPFAAGVLIGLALAHPDPLVSVSAAVAQADLFDDPRLAYQRLMLAAVHERGLAGETARVALDRLTHPEPAARVAAVDGLIPAPPDLAAEPGYILVHGTTNFLTWVGAGIWPDWWRPGEPLHRYLREEAGADAFAGDDYFRWGGAYNDQGRDDGAWMLRHWLARHAIPRPRLVTHSHGGNVAMHASLHHGVHIDRLILLACPVHWHLYRPHPERVGSTVSIRLHFDVLILADRGGQRFEDGSVEEIVLDSWFIRHGDPCKPEVWREFGLSRYL